MRSCNDSSIEFIQTAFVYRNSILSRASYSLRGIVFFQRISSNSPSFTSWVLFKISSFRRWVLLAFLRTLETRPTMVLFEYPPFWVFLGYLWSYPGVQFINSTLLLSDFSQPLTCLASFGLLIKSDFYRLWIISSRNGGECATPVRLGKIASNCKLIRWIFWSWSGALVDWILALVMSRHFSSMWWNVSCKSLLPQ